MKKKLTLCLLVLGSALGAQSYITSPKGYLTTEGATNHNYMLFSKSVMRWQAIDRSHQGSAPRPILSVAWRRDGAGATSSTFATRTLGNFEFYMADSDYNTTQVNNLDLNYKGTPTNCIKKRATLVLPDRTTKPASSPAPWDIQLKFDTPFLYTAKDAFLWEVRYAPIRSRRTTPAISSTWVPPRATTRPAVPPWGRPAPRRASPARSTSASPSTTTAPSSGSTATATASRTMRRSS